MNSVNDAARTGERLDQLEDSMKDVLEALEAVAQEDEPAVRYTAQVRLRNAERERKWTAWEVEASRLHAALKAFAQEYVELRENMERCDVSVLWMKIVELEAHVRALDAEMRRITL